MSRRSFHGIYMLITCMHVFSATYKHPTMLTHMLQSATLDMKRISSFIRFIFAALMATITIVTADDPYDFLTWSVTYGTISPLGVPQQGILINGLFPGPQLDVVTNDNIIINVFNHLDEPFLLTWNGIKQRKNSWQDGVLGTNCPIPPGGNYTYRMQSKDQIGTFTYFPSTAMHRAAGGFGSLNVFNRAVIALPYPVPDGDFALIVGDWYKSNHEALRERLDSGSPLRVPDGLLINGLEKSSSFTGDQGKTYRFRFSNVGLTRTINFRIQGHTMRLVEVEGSHVMQTDYSSLDLHVGQSMAILVKLNQPPRDYYIVATARFSKSLLSATGVLRYSNSKSPIQGPIPPPPVGQHHWSVQQARTIRWNLTANAARPNPQGSYHYGSIPVTRTLVLGNSVMAIGGKLRYAVNGVSFVVPDTPLKLADHFNIPAVFTLNGIPTKPPVGAAAFGTPAVGFLLHDFVEIVFQNDEETLQTWHLDGYDFWVVGYGLAQAWTPALRVQYNLVDAPTRYTVQVYRKGWTAILVSLDNEGMWNLRSSMWGRQYLGQQLYLRVWSPEVSIYNQYVIPPNALLCGKAKGLRT